MIEKSEMDIILGATREYVDRCLSRYSSQSKIASVFAEEHMGHLAGGAGLDHLTFRKFLEEFIPSLNNSIDELRESLPEEVSAQYFANRPLFRTRSESGVTESEPYKSDVLSRSYEPGDRVYCQRLCSLSSGRYVFEGEFFEDTVPYHADEYCRGVCVVVSSRSSFDMDTLLVHDAVDGIYNIGDSFEISGERWLHLLWCVKGYAESVRNGGQESRLQQSCALRLQNVVLRKSLPYTRVLLEVSYDSGTSWSTLYVFPAFSASEQIALDEKAEREHKHEIGDIRGLEERLLSLQGVTADDTGREVVTVADVSALESIPSDERSTEVIYVCSDDSSLYLWNGVSFVSVTHKVIDDAIYVRSANDLLDIPLEQGSYTAYINTGVVNGIRITSGSANYKLKFIKWLKEKLGVGLAEAKSLADGVNAAHPIETIDYGYRGTQDDASMLTEWGVSFVRGANIVTSMTLVVTSAIRRLESANGYAIADSEDDAWNWQFYSMEGHTHTRDEIVGMPTYAADLIYKDYDSRTIEDVLDELDSDKASVYEMSLKGSHVHWLSVGIGSGVTVTDITDSATTGLPDDGWRIDEQKVTGCHAVYVRNDVLDTSRSYLPGYLTVWCGGNWSLIFNGGKCQYLNVNNAYPSLLTNASLSLVRYWDATLNDNAGGWGAWHDCSRQDIVVDSNDIFDSAQWDTSSIDVLYGVCRHAVFAGSYEPIDLSANPDNDINTLLKKHISAHHRVRLVDGDGKHIAEAYGELYWIGTNQVLVLICDMTSDSAVSTPTIRFYHRHILSGGNGMPKFVEFSPFVLNV